MRIKHLNHKNLQTEAVRIDTKANTQPTQYPTHLALAYTLQDVRKPLHKYVIILWLYFTQR